MVTQDTSQWIAKKQGKVKQFLGNSIAELNLETPPEAEKVTLYDQRDGTKLVVPRHMTSNLLAEFYTTSTIVDGSIVSKVDKTRKLYDWTPPPNIENNVDSAVETVSKISGNKRKRGKRGRRK